MKRIAPLALTALLAACSSTPSQQADVIAINDGHVCSATLAKVFNKDFSQAQVSQDAELWVITYLNDEGEVDTQSKCKLDGETVVWGNYPDGRWRDMVFDPSFSYTIEGQDIVITETTRNGESQARYTVQ